MVVVWSDFNTGNIHAKRLSQSEFNSLAVNPIENINIGVNDTLDITLPETIFGELESNSTLTMSNGDSLPNWLEYL